MYLDSFSKKFGENRKIGETFWNAVVDLAFPTQTSRMPMLRTAFIATNLVSPKVVDGVSRLIVKTDVQALTQSKRLLQVSAAEEILAEAWARLAAAVPTIDQTMCYAIFGRLSSRVVLFLARKQKDGPDNVLYTGLAEINIKFNDEFATAASGSSGASAMSGSSTTHKSDSVRTESKISLEDMSDPKFIANQAGFKVNELYTDKQSGKVFVMEAMADRSVTFREKHLAPREPEVKHVSYDDLKKTFMVFKGKLPVKIQGVPANIRPATHALFRKDRQRAALFNALLELSLEHQEGEELVEFYLSPSEVRARGAIKKGALKLVPMTELSRIHIITAKVANSNAVIAMTAEGDHHEFNLTAPMRPPKEDEKEWKPEHVFAAFWWVQKSTDESEVNMKLTKVRSSEFSVPLLENTKALKAFDKLVMAAPEETTAPASAAKKRRR